MKKEIDENFLSTLGAHKPKHAETLYKRYNEMYGHIDVITCPECDTVQAARVIHNHGMPFASFIHTCGQCGYTIMESEWNPTHGPDGRRKLIDPLGPGKYIEQLPAEDELRSLSWKQPYGELMKHGKIETRVWDTKYRGYVLICASKKGYGGVSLVNISGFEQIDRMNSVIPGLTTGNTINPGKAIAIGKLVNSRPMTSADEDSCFVKYVEPWEEVRTDKYGVGHVVHMQLWCHIYEDVHAIEPFPWQGSQGWRKLTWEEKKKIIIL